MREIFELHGFAPIETRAVEPLDQLLRKGETDKEIYLLRRLQAEPTTPTRGLGLHFDLTVPFARYVLENAGKLDFPLRRYQIQKAWRGERPQEGRYREFTQADIDVIDRDTLPVPLRGRAAAGDGRCAGRGCRSRPCGCRSTTARSPRASTAASGSPTPLAVLRDRRQARQDRPGERARDQLVDDRRLHASAGRRVPRARRDPHRRHVVRRPGRGARRAATTLLDRGPGRAGRGHRGRSRARARAARRRPAASPAAWTTTPARSSRPRMVGHEQLGSICSGGRYDALATDGETHLSRRRALARRDPAARAGCFGQGTARGQPVGADLRAGRAARRGVPAHAASGIAPRCERAGSRPGRAGGREVRQADPLRRAPRHPVRLVPAGRTAATRCATSAAASRSTPTAGPGRRPRRDRRPQVIDADQRGGRSDPHP